ncbi:hypothetical protein JCM10049v2_005009 [Rhodotorula toruloides]
MADSPRRNAQANRQARRQSPYARPAPQPAQSTPSRLRSLLSYVSPFRSARKGNEREPTPPREDDASDDEAAVKDEEGDSADEAAHFALHGSVLPLADAPDQHAPASPTPDTLSDRTRQAGGSSGTLSASASMPNFAARSLATPRFPGNYSRSPSFAHFADAQSARTAHSAVDSISSTATHELARFFQEKASRGDEHLTAVEQAGVLQLMQRAQNVPTAFTPNFHSTHDAAPSFSPGLAAPQQRTTTSSALPKRRRPVYVGAGYSSRRRKTLAGLSGSQSESSLASLASGPDATDGKRRRTERDEEDDIPVASLDDVLASPAPSSRGAKAALPTQSARPAVRNESRAAATPAKPSPLWQVSQTADAPTPSPPRNTASIKPSTRAADMMLDIIRQEDEARAPPAKVAIPKGAILNPYDSEENLLSVTGPAKKSKPAPKKVVSPKLKSPAPQPRQEKPKPAPPAISPLEQLERTMPAEYRRETSKPSKPAKAAELPKPASKPKEVPKKKPAEVLTLSDSEDEDDEEENASMEVEREDEGEEEEDELEEEEEQQEEEEEEQGEELPPPPFAAPKSSKTKKSTAAPPSAFRFSASTASVTSPFSFGQSASSAAPSKAQAGLTSASAQSPAQPAFSFSPATPAANPFSAAPAAGSSTSPFTFTPAPSAASAPSASTEPSTTPRDPKSAALALSKPELPLLQFGFDGVFPSTGSKEEDKALAAVKDIVRGMSKAELPSFAF